MRPSDIGRVSDVDATDPAMPIQVEFNGSQYWYEQPFPQHKTATSRSCPSRLTNL